MEVTKLSLLTGVIDTQTIIPWSSFLGIHEVRPRDSRIIEHRLHRQNRGSYDLVSDTPG